MVHIFMTVHWGWGSYTLNSYLLIYSCIHKVCVTFAFNGSSPLPHLTDLICVPFVFVQTFVRICWHCRSLESWTIFGNRREWILGECLWFVSGRSVRECFLAAIAPRISSFSISCSLPFPSLVHFPSLSCPSLPQVFSFYLLLLIHFSSPPSVLILHSPYPILFILSSLSFPSLVPRLFPKTEGESLVSIHTWYHVTTLLH